MDCRECIFSKWIENKQSDCAAGRIDKFILKGKATLCQPSDDELYYSLQQFCTLYRTEEWVKKVKTEDPKELLDKALDSVKPLFGIVVHYTNDSNMNQLKTTVESLMKLDYDRKKVKIVISSPYHQQCEDIVHFTNILKEAFPASESVFHLHDEIELRDTECFKKIVEAMYFVKIQAGGTLEQNVFNTIDHIINHDLSQICMFETDCATIIMKNLVTRCYLEFKNYDLATEYIRNLCIKQDKYEKI